VDDPVAPTTAAQLDSLSDDLRAAVGKLWRRIRSERGSGQLNELQYSVLAFLVRTGPRTFTEMAEFVQVSPPSITRTADRLVGLGLAQRERDESDARVFRLAATGTGEEFVSDVHRRRSEWLAGALDGLTDEQRLLVADAAPILRALAESGEPGGQGR